MSENKCRVQAKLKSVIVVEYIHCIQKPKVIFFGVIILNKCDIVEKASWKDYNTNFLLTKVFFVYKSTVIVAATETWQNINITAIEIFDSNL